MAGNSTPTMSWSGRSWQRSSAIPASQSRTSPDDIMPQIPELAEFPVPPGLKKYIDATRIVAGASVPTSAACIAAAFNLLAAEDIDVQSRANAPHPSGLYFVVGSESGWRKSASFRETMQGHVEADERVEVLHHEADSNTEGGHGVQSKGVQPPGPCGKTSPSRPCSAGCGRPAGPWRWPTATPRRSWAAGVSERTT